MRKTFIVLFMFLFLFTLGAGAGASAQPTVEEQERVLVYFKTKADKNAIAQAKGSVKREYKHVPALAASIPKRAKAALLRNPNVLFVEQDQAVKIHTQTPDWGIARTGAATSWESGYTGKGVKVAVIDTGAASHDDLVLTGGVSLTSYTTSYLDDNGHGTHVAGIIGAKNNTHGTVGIAHEASIYAVKALDANGSGYLSDVIAGIDWSIANRMDIVNLSLGTSTHSSTLQSIVDKAYAQGILVVAAAGNNGALDGSGDTVNYPARYDSVIAVAASDASDQRASFSATGSAIEVAAPGASVSSTHLGNGYARMSGTSMAAPYAAGNLALLKQAYPELTHVQLRAKLQELVVDLGSAGKDSWFGFGLIQAPKQTSGTTPAPAPSEPTVKTSTSVSTEKATYVAGEKIKITVKVANEAGTAISGAKVKLAIEPPKGSAMTAEASTNDLGQAVFTLTLKRTSEKGTYQVRADASYPNATGSSATTSFQFK